MTPVNASRIFFRFENFRHGIPNLSEAPSAFRTESEMDVTPSLSVELDPGFAFPDTVGTIILSFERMIISFNLSGRPLSGLR